jgi:ethanolamine utilization protein EutQ (cupin superfamily)
MGVQGQLSVKDQGRKVRITNAGNDMQLPKANRKFFSLSGARRVVFSFN